MKKIYIVIIIVVLIVLGALFFVGKGNKAQAPEPLTNSQVETPVTSDTSAQGVGLEEKPLNQNSGVAADVNGVKEFMVSGQNFSFTPNVINVNKGDKVRIVFKNTAGFHDFKIDEFGIASQTTKAPYQEILEFTANKVGSFVYYCSVSNHRAMGMFGTLNVK